MAAGAATDDRTGPRRSVLEVRPRRTPLLSGGGRPPRWPLWMLFAGYPLVWAFGLGPLGLPLLTGLMLLWLLRYGRHLLVPRGSGLWFAFLLWAFLSLFALDLLAPGTTGGGGAGAFIAFAYRLVMYGSATALLVYLSSTTEDEVPSRLVVRSLGWLFVAAVAGGYLGLAVPDGNFTTPFEMVLPDALLSNGLVQAIVHPYFAQVQDVLGSGNARPSAPFTYTNEWGAMMAFLLPAFVVDRLVLGDRRRRLWGGGVLALSVVPVVLSLNRGLWLSLALAGGIGCVLLIRSRPRMVVPIAAAAVLVGLAVSSSPLGAVLDQRASSEHSLSARSFIVDKAVRGALASPVIGWGGPRQPEGNPTSRVQGETAECPKCSPPSVGTHGQLWLVLFSNGVVGAALFYGYFVRAGWRLRRPRDAVDSLALVIISVWMLQMFFYPGVPWSLHIVMALVALTARGSLSRPGGHTNGHPTA